jgi:hypothetical protein
MLAGFNGSPLTTSQGGGWWCGTEGVGGPHAYTRIPFTTPPIFSIYIHYTYHSHFIRIDIRPTMHIQSVLRAKTEIPIFSVRFGDYTHP